MYVHIYTHLEAGITYMHAHMDAIQQICYFVHGRVTAVASKNRGRCCEEHCNVYACYVAYTCIVHFAWYSIVSTLVSMCSEIHFKTTSVIGPPGK